MALSPQDQIQKLLSSAGSVLILLPENTSGDSLAGAYGLSFFLDGIGVEATIAFKNKNALKETYNFLPKPKTILHSLAGLRDFTITLNTEHNDVLGVHSERTGNELQIHITPEKGIIDSRDLSFGLSPFKYDILFTLGADSKESFGKLGEEMPDIFYDIPVINIDYKSDNERFGQINLITLTASSISELLTQMCSDIADEHITNDVAQCFLTGIIIATDSFRDAKTTPNALSLASMLIDAGADQQEIVTHLYKSQPLSLVQLWGQTLSKLEVHEDGQIVSTAVSKSDFHSTETAPHMLPLIIEKIKRNHTTATFFILIYENEDPRYKNCVALIDASRYGTLPQQTFGSPTEDDLYEITFTEGDCENGREKIADLLTTLISQKTQR